MRLKRSPMRQRLKDRRACESFELEVAGQRYTATIGRYVDGTIGEIFLQSRKPGSQSDANASWQGSQADDPEYARPDTT